MGIERFFTTINDNSITNLTDAFNTDLKDKLDITDLFIDFNSIIHVNSARVINELNLVLVSIITGRIDDKTQELIESYRMNDITTVDLFTEMIDESIDDIIRSEVVKYVYKILESMIHSDKLKRLYIAIDGVPSCAKMAEQKKRRYMGAVVSCTKYMLKKKYIDLLKKDKKRYIFEENKVTWSKINIGPGSVFMYHMDKKLKSERFEANIKNICTELMHYRYSGPYERDEGEAKIVDYIMNDKYIGGRYAIYSPDSDVIALSLLLNVDYSFEKKSRIPDLIMIRYNQQSSSYDIVDIELLKKNIISYIRNNAKISDSSIISDVVFLFVVFGNDFVPKIESLSVSTDFTLILDIYTELIDKWNSPLIIYNKKTKSKYINYDMFLAMIGRIHKIEMSNLQNVYLSSNYRNYKYIKEALGISHGDEFVAIMNEFSQMVYRFSNDIKNNKDMSRWEDEKDFMMKLMRLTRYDSNNIHDFIKDNISNHKKTGKIMYIDTRLLPFSKSIDDKFMSSKLEHKFDYLNNAFKITPYDKEIFKFENMLDEYVDKLNNFRLSLGRVYMDKFVWKSDKMIDGVKKYYHDMFDITDLSPRSPKMAELIREYLKGISWVLDMYMNRHKIKVQTSTWSYPYLRAPLITQIYHYLKHLNDKTIFAELSDEIQKTFIDEDDYFNAIELILYVSPAKNTMSVIPDEYRSFIKNNDYYIDTEKISRSILKSKHPVDCRGMIFLNKCHITDNNDINPVKFIKSVRKIEMSQETKDLAGMTAVQKHKHMRDYAAVDELNNVVNI